MDDAVAPPVSDEALRAEAQAFLQANWDPAKYRAAPATGSGVAAANHRAWLAKVVEGRWVGGASQRVW